MRLLSRYDSLMSREQWHPTGEEGPKPLFELGQVVATPGALSTLAQAEVDPASLITRHVTGDWGDMVEEDKMANEEAVTYGHRVFSAYQLESGEKIWVITEWDRSYTTILLPDEY